MHTKPHLPPAELALLGQLSLLRRSVKLDQIISLFLCSPPVQIRTARELEGQIQCISFPSALPVHFLFDLAESVRETVTESLQEAQIAGPEDVFRQSAKMAVENALNEYETRIEDDLEELMRLYGKTTSEVPTAERPLLSEDQQLVRHLIDRFHKLRSHPLFPYQEPPAQLKLAFNELGWSKPSQYVVEDMGPADVIMSFRGVKHTLQRFAIKHRAAAARSRAVPALPEQVAIKRAIGNAGRRRVNADREHTRWPAPHRARGGGPGVHSSGGS